MSVEASHNYAKSVLRTLHDQNLKRIRNIKEIRQIRFHSIQDTRRQFAAMAVFSHAPMKNTVMLAGEFLRTR